MQSTLSWVAGQAAVRNRNSPVKFLKMKAAVPAEAARAQGWVPGQSFRGRIFVQRKAEGLSVPNVAIVSDEGRSFVQVQDGAGFARREVSLGARGPGRSEVLSGLAAGERVLLTPRALAPEPAPAAAAPSADGGAGR